MLRSSLFSKITAFDGFKSTKLCAMNHIYTFIQTPALNNFLTIYIF